MNEIATATIEGVKYRLADNGNYTWVIQRRQTLRGWVSIHDFRTVDAANAAWERFYVVK